MGSLSSLYVSQSYQSLLHLGSDTSFFPPLATAPQGFIQIQDGLGYSMGFAISSSGDVYFSHSVIIAEDFIVSGSFDIEGKVTVNDNVRVNGNLEVSGATTLTGSLVVSNDITASNMFLTNDLVVSGTINAYEIITTIESSSIIFSSGSNILGDTTLDTQTLIGDVIMSGSSLIIGNSTITGSQTITNNLDVIGNISSSTISGIGNVTLYSQSVDNRLDYLEGPFSTSVDFRLDELEAWSSSVQTDFVTETELTQTASFLQNQIDQKLFTSSFNAYTQSTNSRLNVIETTYATTGSNTFRGAEVISGSLEVSGSMIYSGSVRGQVFPITILSNTASIDCSKGNFFTLTLPAGNTRLEATNIQPGETLSLRILNSTSASAVSSSTSVKFPTGFSYVPTAVSASTDIITFLTFDTGSIFAVAANYFA